MLLFDEPDKAITSEAKVANNIVDELKKIIDDAVKDMTQQPPTANVPQDTSTTL